MTQNDSWVYLNKYRRHQRGVHQLYKEGKWITIDLGRDKPPNSNAPQ